MNKLKLGVGLADIALGAGIVNNELKSGNLTGREKLYHNTKEENIESIKRNGILSERAADKDNLTQSTLGNFLSEEDMAGLTYLGRQRRVANLVGVGAKWADKNKASRETLILNAINISLSCSMIYSCITCSSNSFHCLISSAI